MCRLSMTSALSEDQRITPTITIQPSPEARGQERLLGGILLAFIGIQTVLLVRGLY